MDNLLISTQPSAWQMFLDFAQLFSFRSLHPVPEILWF